MILLKHLFLRSCHREQWNLDFAWCWTAHLSENTLFNSFTRTSVQSLNFSTTFEGQNDKNVNNNSEIPIFILILLPNYQLDLRHQGFNGQLSTWGGPFKGREIDFGPQISLLTCKYCFWTSHISTTKIIFFFNTTCFTPSRKVSIINSSWTRTFRQNDQFLRWKPVRPKLPKKLKI